jgi:hypothetical protein
VRAAATGIRRWRRLPHGQPCLPPQVPELAESELDSMDVARCTKAMLQGNRGYTTQSQKGQTREKEKTIELIPNPPQLYPSLYPKPIPMSYPNSKRHRNVTAIIF